MRLLIYVLLCTLSIAYVPALSGQPTLTDSARLYAIIDTAWSFRSIQRPLDTEEQDDFLGPDLSQAAIDHRAAFWRSIGEQLDAIDQTHLSRADQINLRIFRYITEDQIASFRFKAHLRPFNAEGGFHTSFGGRPANMRLRDQEAAERYLARLESCGRQVDHQLVQLQMAIQTGHVLPADILGGYDSTAFQYVTETVEESVFFRPFTTLPEDMDPAVRQALLERGRAAISGIVFPAYQRLGAFLRDAYIPAAPVQPGASGLPDGDAYYAQRVRHFTTLDMSPREVFETGLAEVARIRTEMEKVIGETGFTGSFAEFLEFLRTDPQFYASTPRELLAEASYFSKRIDGLLPQYFGNLPRLPYGVAPVPDHIAPRYTGGRYVPGSYERHRAGTYWVNTYKLDSRPLYVLPSLTLHEAVPGHHLQMSLAAELEGLPAFRNRYYISAFGEGWALYTEWLGHEMGMYETPYERFGALTYEMWRACRLVVDPGIHAFGWTRDEAVAFMTENTALSLHEINTEVNRYIGWPGQAVSYKIGELTIRRLREEAEQVLGAAFDLRAFHDKILENGSVPLFILEEEVRMWMATVSGPAGN